MKALIEWFDRINKTNEYPISVRLPILLLSNWTFQGFFYMDRTERVFKIASEVSETIMLLAAMLPMVPAIPSLILTIATVHTANWMLNCQFFALMRKFGCVKTTRERFTRYLNSLAESSSKASCLQSVNVYGSMARGVLEDTSDLDIRILRKRGVVCGIKACTFAARQRIAAFFMVLPLDIYIYDDSARLDRMREEPVILFRSTGAQRDGV